jgi:hypothetical protein
LEGAKLAYIIKRTLLSQQENPPFQRFTQIDINQKRGRAWNPVSGTTVFLVISWGVFVGFGKGWIFLLKNLF